MVDGREPPSGRPRRALLRPAARARRDPTPAQAGSPAEKSFAEEFYYRKQMAGRTPMVVRLTDGEILSGWIEWYDRDCIKLNRDDGPNLLVMKSAIRYQHKVNDADETESSETPARTGIRRRSSD